MTNKILKYGIKITIIAILFSAFAIISSINTYAVETQNTVTIGKVKGVKKSTVKKTFTVRMSEKQTVKYKYNYGIKITWKKVKNAEKYNIYRYENAAQKWTKIKATKKTSYILTNMIEGEKVKIRIKAYKNGVEGKPSKTLKFTTKQTYRKISKDYKMFNFESKWASQDAFVLQNEYRVKKGKQPLIWNETLYEIAKIRTEETLVEDCEAHCRPDGTSFLMTFREYFGVEKFLEYGGWDGNFSENIGVGQVSTSDIIEGWINSEGHRLNLLNSNWNYGAICVFETEGVTCWLSTFSAMNVD